MYKKLINGETYSHLTEISKEVYFLILKDNNYTYLDEESKEYGTAKAIYSNTLKVTLIKIVNFISGTNYYIQDTNA